MSLGIRYVIGADTVTRQHQTGGSWRNLDTKPAGAVAAQLTGGKFDSELMPPGVRLVRTAGEYTQVLLECPPAINRICMSRSESEGHSGNFTQYLVAQPWRVIHAAYRGTQMIGARMFYRPGPIYTMDDELYHVNLPNINCRGYHGTGVGWVCFYGDGSTHNMTWPQRLARLLERCSGTEGYNGNMSSIDGRAHYRTEGAPSWTYTPSSWEKKTDKQGLALATDHDWLPIKVTGPGAQKAHDPNGVPLTVGMAVNGVAPLAYGDSGVLPGIHAAPAEGADASLLQTINTAYAKGAQR